MRKPSAYKQRRHTARTNRKAARRRLAQSKHCSTPTARSQRTNGIRLFKSSAPVFQADRKGRDQRMLERMERIWDSIQGELIQVPHEEVAKDFGVSWSRAQGLGGNRG